MQGKREWGTCKYTCTEKYQLSSPKIGFPLLLQNISPHCALFITPQNHTTIDRAIDISPPSKPPDRVLTPPSFPTHQ